MKLKFNFGVIYMISLHHPEQDQFGKMVRLGRDLAILINAGWVPDAGSIHVADEIRKEFKKLWNSS
jgi:hypothetical protein